MDGWMRSVQEEEREDALVSKALDLLVSGFICLIHHSINTYLKVMH